MQLKTLALLGIAAAVGYVWLKGLHLDDIKQIVVQKGQQVAAGDFGSFTGGPGQTPAPTPVAGGAGSAETIRIATFNIEVFGDAKTAKSHVVNEIAKIIGQFDLVAIQEIRTQEEQFANNLAYYVSHVTKRNYRVLIGPRLGNTTSKEQYAYIYDAERIAVNSKYIFTVGDRENLLHREPYVAMFAARAVPDNQRFTFVLMNVHTDPDVAGDEMNVLGQAYDSVSRHASQMNEDDLILLGDLNTDVPNIGPSQFGRQSRPLRADDLYGLARIPNLLPVVTNEPTNTIKTKLHHNILINRTAPAEFIRGGVYDIGAIHGLNQAQVAEISDHLPVWAEFSAYEGGQPQMAGVGAGVTR